MATNGGWTGYPDQVIKPIFARASDRETRTGTVKSGQVLKALSFVETDINGKWIAHGGIVESATVTFGAAITTNQTVILAGLTFTAGSGSVTVTALQLADIWAGLPSNATAAQANAIILAKGYSATDIGVFSGTLTGYATTAISSTKVRFDAVGAGIVNTTDVAITGTGAAAGTVALTAFATFNKISGITVYDIDASSADVDAAVYVEASFWADAIVWAVDATVDFVTKTDGTLVACSAYNTGCSGTSSASNLLKAKFVEGTEFEPLTFKAAGEIY